MPKFYFYKQLDSNDCGPACLRMIARYHGKYIGTATLRERSGTTLDGTSFKGIIAAAESIGFRTRLSKISWKELKEKNPFPCIIPWANMHFVVLRKIRANKVYIADPELGLVKYDKEEFLKYWMGFKQNGVILTLEPTNDFYQLNEEEEKTSSKSWHFLLPYIRPYKKYFVQLFLGIILGSILQLIFPFLTQSIVDQGINYQNLGFINLILIAQLMLTISQTAVDFIRSWILFFMSTRINISLISDFLIKLMKLPVGFFDNRSIGDLLQRVGDHQRIESFMTNSTLSIFYAILTTIVFGTILAIYNITIFFVFFIGSLVSIFWIMFFLKKRKVLDNQRFQVASENRSKMIETVEGINEIKINNYAREKRWEWENIQAKFMKVRMRILTLGQTQRAGGVFINEVKNILITYFAATAVIEGKMTLGMMLAAQYIIGQLNGPIRQVIDFFQTGQDAKTSMERIAEIHDMETEEGDPAQKIYELYENKTLHLENISFRYSEQDDYALDGITLTIPSNKVIALVGTSGSGKTTLLKLLLNFYQPSKGKISVGQIGLNDFDINFWRSQCGVVMQDGFIFSDTVTRNITLSSEPVDDKKLLYAAEVANIRSFIERLRFGFNTIIGKNGVGLSQGQKQRILIARAIYKNPSYLFFDEATSSLDAKNEKDIVKHLEEFYKDKTVVIVAHSLSTVKNADQIVVLEKGKIVEQGTHTELVAQKGAYYKLVKNQLELGN